MREIFHGVYKWQEKLWTKNLVPGQRVYGEKLAVYNGVEYREWNPFRSKLAAAIKKKLKSLPLYDGSKVLYLGVAEGTTASHISDIIGSRGVILGIDISEKCIAKLVQVSEERKNILPLAADANRPETYAEYAKEIMPDIIYQDIAQKNQVEILEKNARFFLGKGNFAMLALKAPSIDSTSNAKRVFSEQESMLERSFEISEKIPLEPFEKKHRFYLLVRK
ncbi:MAG: fibrillarin-like rRNA/tRNA 2'-O-methyltransferase [Candidatus Diapherotrites archaeon]|nr:fibrillarin-like rRNA/tRNA 2'-O-methyltransferase [Candidatus Diapherotrites archaeon]